MPGAPRAIFNEATALAFTGGDRRLLGEIARLFLSNYPKQVKDLQQAVESGEGPPVHRAAHALKGALATLGAERALALARRVEAMGSTNALSGARDACRALEGELEALKRSLAPLTKTRARAAKRRQRRGPSRRS